MWTIIYMEPGSYVQGVYCISYTGYLAHGIIVIIQEIRKQSLCSSSGCASLPTIDKIEIKNKTCSP